MTTSGYWVETDIPSRLDRLPWSRWHWLIVIALGITWILDGLQVTLSGAIGATLRNPMALGLSEGQIGAAASFYLAGAVLGALVFGWSTDRFGRKKLFYITLAVYLSATLFIAFSWNFGSYAFSLAVAGAGIGGEYAAINSAIDELIPARVRGRVDLIINSTYWLGASLGAGATVILLNPRIFPVWLGWRLAFGIGALLGLIVLYFRHWVPESPRWLTIHGRHEEAERIIAGIEATIRQQKETPEDNQSDNPSQMKEEAALTEKLTVSLSDTTSPNSDIRPIRIRTRTHTPWSEIWQAIAIDHRSRSFLALVLMSAQAFFYNAIFFTYALVLVRFYAVPARDVSWYILPFALGNLLGPVVIGHLFDSIGRKPMICITYGGAGLLLASTAFLFKAGLLTATTQTICWTVIFFIASSAASAAYLTVSEIFPLEIRGLAIAIFYATGTLVGGVFAPLLFADLIQTGSRDNLTWGYLGAAALMILAAATEAKIGVAAERKSLETITAPLSSRE